MTCISRTLIALNLAGMLCLAGCSGGGPETVPVYGKVNFIGRDVPDYCKLFFRPTETAGITRPTSATMTPDGSYEVKAFRHSKGLIPGTYQIQVSYFDLKPGASRDAKGAWNEFKHDAGELLVEADSSGIEHNIEVPGKS